MALRKQSTDGMVNWYGNQLTAQQNTAAGTPSAPTAVLEKTPTTAAAPTAYNNMSAEQQDAAFNAVLPEHLRPKISTDENGNEIITIQGSFLNKIMNDMFNAGSQSHLQQNPNMPGGNPYSQNQTTPSVGTAKAQNTLNQLQETYPQYNRQYLTDLLQGKKPGYSGVVPEAQGMAARTDFVNQRLNEAGTPAKAGKQPVKTHFPAEETAFVDSRLNGDPAQELTNRDKLYDLLRPKNSTAFVEQRLDLLANPEFVKTLTDEDKRILNEIINKRTQRNLK